MNGQSIADLYINECLIRMSKVFEELRESIKDDFPKFSELSEKK